MLLGLLLATSLVSANVKETILKCENEMGSEVVVWGMQKRECQLTEVKKSGTINKFAATCPKWQDEIKIDCRQMGQSCRQNFVSVRANGKGEWVGLVRGASGLCILNI